MNLQREIRKYMPTCYPILTCDGDKKSVAFKIFQCGMHAKPRGVAGNFPLANHRHKFRISAKKASLKILI